MVQCDHCAAWQHLPCLWWALNLAITSPDTKPSDRSLCEAALAAAQAAGSGYLNGLVGPGTSGGQQTGSALSVTASSGKGDGNEPPYFCPICLNLQALTLASFCVDIWFNHFSHFTLPIASKIFRKTCFDWEFCFWVPNYTTVIFFKI